MMYVLADIASFKNHTVYFHLGKIKGFIETLILLNYNALNNCGKTNTQYHLRSTVKPHIFGLIVPRVNQNWRNPRADSQSVVPNPTSSSDTWEMVRRQIHSPHPNPLSQKFWGWGLAISFRKLAYLPPFPTTSYSGDSEAC